MLNNWNPPLHPEKVSSTHLNNFASRPDLCLKDKSQMSTVFPLPGDLDAGSFHPVQEGQSYLDNTDGVDDFDVSFGLG